MATHTLLMEVRLLAGRYHGRRDWPPSPFRLFQALVAGAYGGRWKTEPRAAKDAAFEWLERLGAPQIAAPASVISKPVTYYVPNNDLDAVGGDPRLAGNLRVAKEVVATLVGEGASLLYAWQFDEGEQHARALCEMAERLHTLGRGTDAAFAHAEVVDRKGGEERLFAHGGAIRSPSAKGGRPDDPTCPTSGSLRSLDARYRAEATRFAVAGRETQFRQAPKADFRTVAYGRAPTRLLFELRALSGDFRPVAQSSVVELASMIRGQVSARLATAMPERASEIRSAVDGSPNVERERDRRVRFAPLPTIGHAHASPSIRRLLVEIPVECPISVADVAWAVSGRALPALTRSDGDTGEVIETELIQSNDDRMLRNYGVSIEARRWRTVTPIVIRNDRPRGRVGGVKQAQFRSALACEVVAAARDAGLPTEGLIVHTQREPFHAKGLRAEKFGGAGRDGRTLVHAELIFSVPVRGPVLLGSGSYDGLGIFRPGDAPGRSAHRATVADLVAPPNSEARRSVRGGDEVARFAVSGGPSIASAIHVTGALRGALMSKLGDGCPAEISGRTESGPLRMAPSHAHAFFLAEDADGDGFIDHVVVYAPGGFGRSTRRAMDGLTKLWTTSRRGETSPMNHEWRVALEIVCPTVDLAVASRLLGFAREWVSLTPYLKPRYDRKTPRDFGERLATYRDQILREWGQRFQKAPLPDVAAIQKNGAFTPSPDRDIDLKEFARTRGGRGGHQPDSVGGFFRLTFPQPVCGPVALGKHAHFGMGVFERASPNAEGESRGRNLSTEQER